MVRIGFIGSSENYHQDNLKKTLDIIFNVFDDIHIINGGYRGTMSFVPEYAKDFVELNPNKKVKIQGVLFDGYSNDPDKSYINLPNEFNDVAFSTKDIGERANSIIEIADIVFVLPGKIGTLHELLQSIETIRYGLNYNQLKTNIKRLYIDGFWEDHFNYLFQNNIISTDIYSLIKKCFYNEEKLEARLQKINNKKELQQPTTEIPPNENNTQKFELFHKISNYISSAYSSNNFQNILGIDIAISKNVKNESQIYRLESYGTIRHLNITNYFLSEYKSLNSVLENHCKWYSYDNPIIEQWDKNNIDNNYKLDQFKIETESFQFGTQEPRVNDWVNFNKDRNFGSEIFIFSLSIKKTSRAGVHYKVSCFVTFQVTLTTKIKENIESIISDFLLKNKIQYILEDSTNDILLEATLNAISTTFARAKSHNTGSHVLSKLLTSQNLALFSILELKNYVSPFEGEEESDLSKIGKILKENKKEKKEEKKQLLSDKDLNTDKLNELYKEQVGNYFSYLKSRDDFLANAVAGVPQSQTSKYFKKELFKSFDEVGIMLDRICGVDDFKYTFKFEGEVTDEKDVLVAIADDVLGNQAFYLILENIIRNTAKHGAKHTICNSGQETDSVKNIFTINVSKSEHNNSYYKVCVRDNRTVEGKETIHFNEDEFFKQFVDDSNIDLDDNKIPTDEQIKDSSFIDKTEWKEAYLSRLIPCEDFESEFKYLGTKDNKIYFEISRINKLVLDQNIWINKKILDENYKLREGALGLIEMEAAATYLRKLPLQLMEDEEFELQFNPNEIKKVKKEIENGTKSLRLFRAVNPKDTEGKYHNVLAYQFYLPMPKEILIIDETGNWLEGLGTEKEEQLNQLAENGILLLSKNDSSLDNKWTFDNNKVYPYELCVINSEDEVTLSNEADVEYKMAYLPNRVISGANFLKNFKEYFSKNKGLYKNTFNAISSKNLLQYTLTKDNELLKLEAWRAYAFEKYESKKLKSPLKRLFNNFNETINMFESDDSNHGDSYIDLLNNQNEVLKSYYNIFESKFKSKLDELKDNDFLTERKINTEVQLNSLKRTEELLSNVLIIDERVQAQCYKNFYSISEEKFSYAQIWDEVNVFIPPANEEDLKKIQEKKNALPYKLEIDNCIDLNATDFDVSYNEKIKKLIELRFNDCEKTVKELDYLVIHLGIIEKILKVRGEDKGKAEIKKFIDEIIGDNKNLKVILTSGRAPTANTLPENVAFLPYPVISQHTIENRFKYNLIEALASARIKK